MSLKGDGRTVVNPGFLSEADVKLLERHGWYVVGEEDGMDANQAKVGLKGYLKGVLKALDKFSAAGDLTALKQQVVRTLKSI